MKFKERMFVGLNNSILWIEHYWKVIVIIALAIICILSIDSCRKNKREKEDAKTIALWNDSSYTSKIKEWKDRYGEEHQRAENLLLSKASSDKAFDSVAKLLNIKSRNIGSVSKSGISISLAGKLKIDTFYKPGLIDTIFLPNGSPSFKFVWEDSWMKVIGNIIGEGKDSLFIHGTDTLSRVDYWKRKWFLARKRHYTDFSNSNPHIKVVGYKGIQVIENRKPWSIGPSVSIGYPTDNINFQKPKVFFGVSAQYNIIRF